MPRRFATAIAILGWTGIACESVVAWKLAKLERRHPARTAFVFLRFFTNLTAIGVSALMSVTAHRLMKRRPQPPASLHAAALVYILVVSTTYELLLRRLWSPRGWWLVRDALMHDVLPLLTLVFWLACAPKQPLRWRDPVLWLAYPLAYLVLVLAAGRAGYGYPYAFIDAEVIGASGVTRVSASFAAAFLGLGLAVVAIAKIATSRDATAALDGL